MCAGIRVCRADPSGGRHQENRLDRAFHLIHSPVIIDGETRRFSRYTSCDDDENQLPLSPECVWYSQMRECAREGR